MRKIIYLFAMFFIALNFSSCNPEVLNDETEPVACCGEDDPIPPPPPLGDGG